MSLGANEKFHKNVAELTRLAAAQIRVTVTESDESVDDLSRSFQDIVTQDRSIRATIEQLPDIPEINEIKEQISLLSSQIGINVQNAVVAFQFYDRLCQRLDHTSECLRSLSEIEDDKKKSSAEEVTKLRDRVYNHFTMEEERQLFDAVLTSKDFEHAITEYTLARAKSLEEDDDVNIELF
ncbi:MAG: hypothetical protein GY829_05705 [Gammaproteobacteria bacterium]|nr:hypothetical protein [Gammaproteobacteria bacterium]